MPTVTLPIGKKRTFAYNAVGKAQASAYANMNGGKLKMKPNYGDELSTETGPKSKAPKKETAKTTSNKKKARLK